MKKITSFIFIFILFNTLSAFAHFLDDDSTSDNLIHYDSDKLVVTELTGLVEAVFSKNDSKALKVGDSIDAHTTIVTGVGSSVSLQANSLSYITINELSNIAIHNILRSSNEFLVQARVFDGFLILYTRPLDNFDTHIVLATDNGKLDFKNAGGQVFVGADHGVLVTATHGKIKVGPKIKTIYWIRAGEMCGITKNGMLIEHDEFIKRKLSHLPTNVIDKESASVFLETFTQPYTDENFTNDYFDNFNP